MASVTFRNLLEQATNNSNGTDITALEGERDKVKAEVNKLEGKLQAAKQRLREVDALIAAPVKAALKAAEVLNIPVPPEYQAQVRQATSHTGGGKSNGSYLWEPGPLGDRTEDLAPQQYEVSRAMWAYSRGSKGSAGKRGEGVLTAEEFWALVTAQTGKSELQSGEQVHVTLPNHRTMKVKRLDGAKTN